jgi:hypothetical protein
LLGRRGGEGLGEAGIVGVMLSADGDGNVTVTVDGGTIIVFDAITVRRVASVLPIGMKRRIG